MNYHQISRISLAPEVVDGIVFWTKNPLPMLDRLGEIKDYMFYFQFTITPYGKDVEPNLPAKQEILSAFKRLSDTIGADRVIWRYDPILISNRYPLEYHIRAFGKIANELRDYTRKVTISFIDRNYRAVKENIKKLALEDFPPINQEQLCSQLAEIAHEHDLTIDTCAEQIDLSKYGIEHARCIDDRLFKKLIGCNLYISKDNSQRSECGCAASVDIGMYNTCKNGCKYCYANYNHNDVDTNSGKHNPNSALLSGEIGKDDKVYERKVKSYREINA
jgi:DNA repair photolyase